MKFFQKIDSFKDCLTSHDLVNLGLYRDITALHRARYLGNAPTYIQIGRRIVWPKEYVASFLAERIKNSKSTTLPSESYSSF